MHQIVATCPRWRGGATHWLIAHRCHDGACEAGSRGAPGRYASSSSYSLLNRLYTRSEPTWCVSLIVLRVRSSTTVYFSSSSWPVSRHTHPVSAGGVGKKVLSYMRVTSPSAFVRRTSATHVDLGTQKRKQDFTEGLVSHFKSYQNTGENSVFQRIKSMLQLCKKVDFLV